MKWYPTPELERQIFEIAANLSLPVDMAALMLVAWRVKTCGPRDPHPGLPLFNAAALLRLIDEKRKTVLANTRHLIIQDPATPHSLESHELDALSSMPALRVLGIHVSRLFNRKRAVLDFTHPVFCNVTHLEVLDTEGYNVPWERLVDIPNLAHLAFSKMWVYPMLVDTLRAHRRQLECLVFLSSDFRAIDVASRRTEVWLVMVKRCSNENWQWGALTGLDCWRAADKFIAERRASRVPSEH
ncbi:hypothetical protein B0H17DRAFT_1151519 [Mycena rosella]|uniref:Uncharacterized protein n=1 Tax=Mycena rosella TaxID=1033263 RepID=A0AAD7BJB2_MYCRO|nr:hypothetical protein B0H17DRAFT_1151519 [Mycena rosella]